MAKKSQEVLPKEENILDRSRMSGKIFDWDGSENTLTFWVKGSFRSKGSCSHKKKDEYHHSIIGYFCVTQIWNQPKQNGIWRTLKALTGTQDFGLWLHVWVSRIFWVRVHWILENRLDSGRVSRFLGFVEREKFLKFAIFLPISDLSFWILQSMGFYQLQAFMFSNFLRSVFFGFGKFPVFGSDVLGLNLQTQSTTTKQRISLF